jgi:LynF/TruF/PatF family peptide O-prenyltransferase
VRPPRLDPAACLRHLDEHRVAFGIQDSPALTRFTELIEDARSCSIECSCKVENGRVNAARFHLCYQEPASREHFETALRFFERVGEAEGVRLDDTLFRRFCDPGYDWTRSEAFVLGVDLRESHRDSRIKAWFKLGDYPEKLDEAFSLPLPGEPDASLRPLVVRPGLLVGFDFHLDGRASVKLYPRIEKTDLCTPAPRARLAAALPWYVLAALERCEWAYVSLSRDGSRVLHFCPTNGYEFTRDLLGAPGLALVTPHLNADLMSVVVSVSEKDILLKDIRDYSLYCMLGAQASQAA